MPFFLKTSQKGVSLLKDSNKKQLASVRAKFVKWEIIETSHM
jgi:hypothetical protein